MYLSICLFRMRREASTKYRTVRLRSISFEERQRIHYLISHWRWKHSWKVRKWPRPGLDGREQVHLLHCYLTFILKFGATLCEEELSFTAIMYYPVSYSTNHLGKTPGHILCHDMPISLLRFTLFRDLSHSFRIFFFRLEKNQLTKKGLILFIC